jgi:SAM-dependent methyltransferase
MRGTYPRPIDTVTRKTLGAWYTPPTLVDHVLDMVLEPVLAARPSVQGLRVLDPACGDGRFLVAAGERIRRRFGTVPDGCLHGIDIDPAAVAAARTALGPGADLRVESALEGSLTASADMSGPGASPGAVIPAQGAYGAGPLGPRLRLSAQPLDAHFDVVVGNPPFLNQLAGITSRGGRSSFGGGPYADTAAVFLALALRVARPDGGRVGLVLPHSVLATRDTAPIRAAALASARLDSVWWAGEPMFDADVLTCVVGFVRGERQSRVRRSWGAAFMPLPDADGTDLADRPTWSHLVADAVGIPAVAIDGRRTLADLATATADFRDQYYGLVPHVGDDVDGPPLVTCGLLDAGRSAWGERPARFARQTLAAPRVARDQLPPALAAWADARLVPKVLVATQTPVIEAAVDAGGEWLPSVPVITVMPRRPEDLWLIGAVLGAPAASAWAAGTYLGAALSANAIKLSASQLLTLPLPARPWDDAADALQAGDVDGCARLMDAAYGTDVYAWWKARAMTSTAHEATPRRRPPSGPRPRHQ